VRSVTERSAALRSVLAVASGLMSAVAFPPWDLGWAAFIALVPLLLALDGSDSGEAAWLGYVAGVAFYLATIWWVINTMTTYGRMPLPLSIGVLLLLCGVLAGYTAAFAWLLTLGARRLALPRGVRPLVASGLWTALEYLRGVLFSGFPWALLGYTQYRQPTVRLLASAVGVYGISALVVLVNGAVAHLVVWGVRAPGGAGSRRELALSLGSAAAAVLISVGYAQFGWQDPTGGPPVRVALLQGNIDQSLKWDESFQRATLDNYEQLVRGVAVQAPALIVWPETALPFFLRREGEPAGRVRRLVRETGIPMLLGSPDVGDGGRLYNTAFLVAGDGEIRGRYDKRHLVPFGEYVPLQRILFFVEKLVVGIGDFGRGEVATVFSLDDTRFSVMICYEVIFPGEVREFVRQGARFLVNITNDAWFGRSGAPYQHLAMAAIRAVENGTFLVRAANTGVTAIIEPTGAIVTQTAIFTRTSLVGTIRQRQHATLYARTGDLLGWIGLVFLAAYGVALLLAGRGGGGSRLRGQRNNTRRRS